MGFSKFNHVKISAIAGVVPENYINIDDEIEYYNNDPKKLERNKKILGLGTRHVVEEGITALDLCEDAAKKLIEQLNVDKTEIDTLIFVSICHDYHSPASSCIVHGRLGLEESCKCFDIGGLSCSAYVYGLWLAHSLISSGASKKLLLLVGDTNSKHADIKNRISKMLYGDAGTATLLEYTDKDNTAYFDLGTKGEGWDKIIAPASGHRFPVRKDIANLEITDDDGNVWHLWEDILQGMDVFNFSMNYAPASVKRLLENSNKTLDDVDFVAMHQANGQIVRMIANHSGIQKNKYSSQTFTKYANCGAGSIATNVCDVLCDKNISSLMLVSFGVGLSWASAIVDFSNTKNLGISLFKNPEHIPTREEMTQYWINKFKGNM